jgi:hypothetical protein
MEETMHKIFMEFMLLAAAVVLLVSGSFADSPVTLWSETYGGPDDDDIASIQQTPDGGYIMVGASASFGPGSCGVYILRTDAHGDTLWTRAYGGADYDFAATIEPTADGGFIIGGGTSSFGSGLQDIYLLRIDANGDTLWTRTYGGPDSEGGAAVCVTSDGGYLISSRTQSFGEGSFDVYLIRTDSNGDTLWTRTYGGAVEDLATNAIQTPDEGFMVSGYTRSYGAGGWDIYLLRTDPNGDTLWTRTYGYPGTDLCAGIRATSDGGYLLVGSTNSLTAGGYDVYILKTDSNGDTLWTRRYGGTENDYGSWANQTSDDGYVVVGHTASFGAGDSDVFLVRTDANGDTLWMRTYGGTAFDAAEDVLQTADQGYIVAAVTWSFGAGGEDGYLIKLSGESPVVRHIADVPNDQGRQVSVSWYRSSLDGPDDGVTITGYSLWRRIDNIDQTLREGSSREHPVLGSLSYPPGDWHYVMTVPAGGEEIYSCVAPTLCDSTWAGMCLSVFFVRAMTPEPLAYFDSEPDSGYSVDNLAPAPPPDLRMLSPTDLAWHEAAEEDFDYFTVYGSETAEFDSSAMLIGQTIGTAMDISEDRHPYYHVTATDFSGNEGDAASVENPYAGVVPTGQLPAAYALGQNRPNPFSLETMVSFDLPHYGRVSLKVFDVKGGLVRTLADGMYPAGRHSVTWAGDDETGSIVAPGIYYMRMDVGDFTDIEKITVLR